MIILRSITGVFLIFLGIAGLVLPVLQGIPLILLGIYLVNPRLAEYLKRKVLLRFKREQIVFFEEWKKNGVRAAFTTRHCPVTFAKTQDLDDKEKRRLFLHWVLTHKSSNAHGLPAYDKFAYLHQVHSAEIVIIESMPDFKGGNFVSFEAADGIVTDVSGLNLVAMSADCLTVYLHAGPWIGLVHAGWRGTEVGIAVKAARLILEKSGLSPERMQVVLGPSICAAHYEVGPEFARIFPNTTKKRGNKFYFDLASENRRQMIDLGIPKKNIISSDLCTFTGKKNLFSFRREKAEAGRMVSIFVKD